MALEKITAEDFNTAIKKLTTSDKSVWWKYLDSTDDGTELCFAVGWQDGYDEDADLYQQDGYTLCAKIGYKHSDTMVMDYSDFREPYDKKGNAWQTDMAVAKGPISDSDVKWYNDEAQRIWDKYGKPDKDGTTALDLMESKKSESAKGSMRRKQESMKKESYPDFATKEDLIRAFTNMKEAWACIVGACHDFRFEDTYGVNDWFNEACWEYDNPNDDDGKKIGDHFVNCFSGSFDELEIDDFCNGMIAYLDTLQEVK